MFFWRAQDFPATPTERKVERPGVEFCGEATKRLAKTRKMKNFLQAMVTNLQVVLNGTETSIGNFQKLIQRPFEQLMSLKQVWIKLVMDLVLLSWVVKKIVKKMMQNNDIQFKFNLKYIAILLLSET